MYFSSSRPQGFSTSPHYICIFPLYQKRFPYIITKKFSKKIKRVEIANNMRQVALSFEGFNDTSCSQYSYRVVSHRGYHALGSRLITDKILISISFRYFSIQAHTMTNSCQPFFFFLFFCGHFLSSSIFGPKLIDFFRSLQDTSFSIIGSYCV